MLVTLLDYKSLESNILLRRLPQIYRLIHIMTLSNWNVLRWSVWSSALGDFVVQLVKVQCDNHV